MGRSFSKEESIVKIENMIALFLLCLGVSSISSHPVSGGKACSTLTSFQKSLNTAVVCKDFQPKTECTTASLEIVKKCLDGIKVDAKCLSEVYEKLSGDQACFCGGLVKFAQMLTSVEALLCAEDQGRVSKLFFANMFDLKEETSTATTSATSTATTTGTGTTAATTTRAPRLIFPNQGTTAATATTASTQSTTRAPRLIFPNQASTTAATTASTQTTTTRAPRLFFPNNLNLPNILGNNGGDAAKPEPDTTTASTTSASTASTATSVASTTTAAPTTATASQTTTTAAATTTTAAPTTTTTAAPT